MRDSQRFNFMEGFDAFGAADAVPKMPLTLTYRNSSIDVLALLDTGASDNSIDTKIVKNCMSTIEQLETAILTLAPK